MNEVKMDEYEKERMTLCLLFEHCLEMPNLPYDSEERKLLRKKVTDAIECLVNKVSMLYERKGRRDVSFAVYENLKKVMKTVEDDAVLANVLG